MLDSKELQHEIEQKCISFFQQYSESIKESNKHSNDTFIIGINQIVKNIVHGKIDLVIIWKDSIKPLVLIENFPLLCMAYNVALCPLEMPSNSRDHIARILKLKRLSAIGFMKSQQIASNLIEFISDNLPQESISILKPLQTYMDYPKRFKLT